MTCLAAHGTQSDTRRWWRAKRPCERAEPSVRVGHRFATPRAQATAVRSGCGQGMAGGKRTRAREMSVDGFWTLRTLYAHVACPWGSPRGAQKPMEPRWVLDRRSWEFLAQGGAVNQCPAEWV